MAVRKFFSSAFLRKIARAVEGFQGDRSGFTKDDLRNLTQILSKYTGLDMPSSLFEMHAKMHVLAYIETVFVRLNDEGVVEFLVLQRSGQDIHWPAMWHSPGTVLRSSDNLRGQDVSVALERVLRDEMGGARLKKKPFWPASVHFINYKRGTSLCLPMVCFLEEDSPLPPGVRWLTLNEIETMRNFISEQLPFLREAQSYVHLFRL